MTTFTTFREWFVVWRLRLARSYQYIGMLSIMLLTAQAIQKYIPIHIAYVYGLSLVLVAILGYIDDHYQFWATEKNYSFNQTQLDKAVQETLAEVKALRAEVRKWRKP